jgi:hypothetical protein
VSEESLSLIQLSNVFCGIPGRAAESTFNLRPVGITPADIVHLAAQAHYVGRRIGWELDFIVDHHLGHGGLTAGTHNTFISGPTPMADIDSSQLQELFEHLSLGKRRIVLDAAGLPHLA